MPLPNCDTSFCWRCNQTHESVREAGQVLAECLLERKQKQEESKTIFFIAKRQEGTRTAAAREFLQFASSYAIETCGRGKTLLPMWTHAPDEDRKCIVCIDDGLPTLEEWNASQLEHLIEDIRQTMKRLFDYEMDEMKHYVTCQKESGEKRQSPMRAAMLSMFGLASEPLCVRYNHAIPQIERGNVMVLLASHDMLDGDKCFQRNADLQMELQLYNVTLSQYYRTHVKPLL